LYILFAVIKLQIGASSGIRRFSVVLEADDVNSCMVNFEDVQNGDNNPQGRMELVQCINPNVSKSWSALYHSYNISIVEMFN
jgi:hypothetical protein